MSLKSEVTQADYLEVFAKTGHDTLKALLIVSCGSVVTFLAVLESLLSNKSVKFDELIVTDFSAAISYFHSSP
ncbi:MAG: hypothetical protein O3C20_01725 [Verrucomicrobia bacterium]|nr:hypothetical protein [Verrucomicrobiota bacterium]